MLSYINKPADDAASTASETSDNVDTNNVDSDNVFDKDDQTTN